MGVGETGLFYVQVIYIFFFTKNMIFSNAHLSFIFQISVKNLQLCY